MKKPEYKIDEDPYGVWNYAVYRKHFLLGILPYWRLLKYTDVFENAEKFIENDRLIRGKIPSYY